MSFNYFAIYKIYINLNRIIYTRFFIVVIDIILHKCDFNEVENFPVTSPGCL